MFNPSSSDSLNSSLAPYDSNTEITTSKNMKGYFIVSLVLELIYVIIIVIVGCTYYVTTIDNQLTIYYIMGTLQIPVFLLHCVTEILAFKIRKKDCRIVTDIIKSQFYQHWSIIVTIFVVVLLEGVSFSVWKTCHDYITSQGNVEKPDDDTPSCKYIKYGDTVILLILITGEFIFGLLFKIPALKTYISLSKDNDPNRKSNECLINATIGEEDDDSNEKYTRSCIPSCRKYDIFNKYKIKDSSFRQSKIQAQTIKALQEENKILAKQILENKSNWNQNSKVTFTHNITNMRIQKDNASSNTSVLNSLYSRIKLDINDLDTKISLSKENIKNLLAEEAQLDLQVRAEKQLLEHFK